ncbi:serine/threonine-protein kinase [Thermoactinospora rubra]|uniref:serine/threonine-protein kinase n=1 Tax=Thermoactinospora rubra TaxID=1088767 RepID=UPI000A106C35|nr:serine/threonine-protein kinase [Thermoactinospora rubra]
MDRLVAGRYRLLEPIGEGGMGVVWRAHDGVLDREVAVKEVRYTGVGDRKRAELNRRTIREARAAGRLDHPSVVVVHDVVEEDGRPWIVMQLVRSRSLAEAIRRRGPLPVPEVARIGVCVLQALRRAHQAGVLHRDVKPENVLLAEDGRVVLTDFGIASMEAEAGLTASGNLVGTPAFTPPERLNGLPATPASDLWSLGATLYTAAEGAPPFRRESWASTVAAVLRDDVEPPRLAGPLAPVIMGLLQRDPAARMGAAQAEAALSALQSGQGYGTPPPAPVPPSSPDRTLPEVRPARRRLWIIPAVLVVALAAAGTAWWATGRRTTAVATPSATSPPAATPSTGTPSTGTPSTTQPVPKPVPAGWRLVRHAEGGFSIAVPRGWSVTRHPTRARVTISGADSPGVLIVEWTTPEKDYPDQVAHLEDLEAQILGRGEFESYRRLGIRPVTYQGRPAADWEFRRMRGGQMIHVLIRGMETPDGRIFALAWEAPEQAWKREKRRLDTFLETFRLS